MTDPDWWRGAVIYQIYPRSFQDSSGNGVGDLKGIVDRLDHVASLGVDAIWISPFFTSPMADMGYDISDFRDVDPIFGTLADFDAVIEKAHALGLKVMIDQVLSHCSDQHPFFVESRASKDNAKADWFVWSDPKPDGSPPSNWQAVFGGPSWTWEPKRRQYYMHNFLSEQPQFNFHNPEVQKWHLDNLRFWLDRGVDGFRFDSVNYHFHNAELTDNPPCTTRAPEAPLGNTYGWQQHDNDKSQPENLAFLQKVRSVLDSYDPPRATVGEIGDGDRGLETMAAYTRDARLNMAYSFELLGPGFTPDFFKKALEQFETHSEGQSWACWAFSNHDVPRHASRWEDKAEDNNALAKVSAALLLSLKGSVCLYQGEELGLPQVELAYEELTDPVGLTFWPEDKGRDGCRTPMPWTKSAAHAGFSTGEPWLPVKSSHVALAADTQDGQSGSVLEFYRAFLHFRAKQSALVKGDIAFVTAEENGLLVFKRMDSDNTVLCAFNLGESDVEFASDDLGEALKLSGFDSEPQNGVLHLAPMQAYFGRLA